MEKKHSAFLCVVIVCIILYIAQRQYTIEFNNLKPLARLQTYSQSSINYLQSSQASTKRNNCQSLPSSSGFTTLPPNAKNVTESVLSDIRHKLVKYYATKNGVSNEQMFKLINASHLRNGINSSHYLTGYFIGGTGNQMFQWATVVCVALHNGLQPYWNNFGHFQNTSLKMISQDLNITKWHSVPDEHFGKYHARVENLTKLYPNKDIKLTGYYQSFKYFRQCEKLMRTEFAPAPEIVDKVLEFYAGQNNEIIILLATSLRIGIHVRRGNIMDEEHYKYGYLSPNVSYYKEAIKFFTQSFTKPIVFVLVGNDLDWIRTNVQPLNPNMIVSENLSPEVDLALLSSCDHVIMSSGTFGWWAGYLSEGLVLYMADYPRPGSYMDEHFDSRDHFPPQWIGLSGLH